MPELVLASVQTPDRVTVALGFTPTIDAGFGSHDAYSFSFIRGLR